ncbi:MAG: serine/threonine protein kinase [Planctomycetes bacterium]|nr:serine/threonine protein kinase [Planctomycetota bacterium]
MRGRIRALHVLDDLGDLLRGAESSSEEDAQAEVESLLGGLGRYRDLRLLGRGGLSRVYVARDPELERHVAIKVVSNAHVSREAARGWVLQEGRTLARLEHPGIVSVFDLGDDEGRTWVAMELVDGPSLADVLAELRAQRADGASASTDPRVRTAAQNLASLGARTQVGLGIARALAACHEAGVLHRDVKPGNVLLEDGTTPKLIDFGLAHLESAEGSLNQVTQRLVATPAYVAPEQIERGATGADPRSDQFSFGVLLYELLTLQTPFQRATRTQTLDAVARAAPPPPRRLEAAIPPDLETICLRALEREPAERYPSMRALADDLEAFLDHRAIAARPPGLARRAQLFVRRRRRDLLLVGVPAIVLLLAWAALWTLRARAAWIDFEARSAAFAAALPGLRKPAEVQTAFLAARELEQDARTLPGAWLAPALGLPQGASSDFALQLISQRLSALLAAARADLPDLSALEREAEEDAVFLEWEAALALDLALCPACTANALDRQRGRVDVPPAPNGTSLEILRAVAVPTPFLRGHEAAGVLELLTWGEYRALWRDGSGGVLAELDIEVHRSTPRTTLHLRPIPAELRARLIRVPAQVRPRDEFGPAFSVDEFWATGGWFGLEDVRRASAEQELSADGRSGDRAPPLRTAIAPAHAAWFARTCALRLPSVNEARCLHALAAEAGASFEPLPPEFYGEYCSSPAVRGERSHLRHVGRLGSRPAIVSLRDTALAIDAPYAFRLVLSTAPATEPTR